MKRHTISLLILALAAAIAPHPSDAQSEAAESKKTNVKNPKALPGAYILAQFGPIDTPQNAADTFKKAEAAILAAGGGVLVIPITAASQWRPATAQQNQLRFPDPPAPASKTWRPGPAYTIIDLREPQILPPSSTGFSIKRQLKIPQGQSLPHWSFDSVLKLRQSLLRGGSSHQSIALSSAPQGKNVKLFLSTAQGVFPGQTLYTSQAFTGAYATVRSLGYDTDTRSWYINCDTTGPIPKDANLVSVTHTAGVMGETWSHNENQTFDMMVWRHNYSQGTNELVNSRFKYMGDNQPYAPDGGSVIFNATARSEIRPFSGHVEAYNRESQTLTFSDAVNTDTLGSGRPIINLNPAKCITSGSIFIMNPGGALLNWGGSVRFTPDAPITTDNIGDYIAIDDPSEHIPGADGVRRWYLISAVDEKSRNLSVIRHWWGAKPNAGISRLYKASNYTNDVEKPVLLKYIIAPGANVYDASEGATSQGGSGPDAYKHALRLAPGPTNTPTPSAATRPAEFPSREFAPGDPITQAVGPDPFSPISLRSWIFEEVPSAFPSPVMDIRNYSKIARYAALRAGNSDIASNGQNFKGPAVPFNSFIEVHSVIQNGILFKGDVPGGGFIFGGLSGQGRNSLFTWKSYHLKELLTGKPRESNITMATSASGQLLLNSSADFNGQSINITGPIGKSGAPSTPDSFRQTAIPIPKGQTTFEVPTQSPVPAQSQILITPSWMTSHVIKSRGKNAGFTIEFDRPAPENATLSWMIIN